MGMIAPLLATVLALQPGALQRERAFALLADNQLIAVDLPSGKVVARRRLGASSQRRAEAGRMLAIGNRRVFVLVSTGSGADAVAALNASSVRRLARWPLEPGVRYRGIVFASDRLFVYGGRLGREIDTAHHLHEQSAVVTVLDAANGATIRTVEIRPASGGNWWIYWAAADATRLALSYHGGCYPDVVQLCTSGADELALSGEVQYRLGEAHGMIEPYDGGWIAATGGETLVQYGTHGTMLRRLNSGIRRDHVMNFRFTRDRTSLLVISSCLYSHEGLRRISLKSATSRLVRGKICGEAAIPASTRIVVRKTRDIELRNLGAARLLRTLSFHADVLDVIVSD
jgi:hypothetical protein